jgi:quercetin dioxygenase-like cupin family protein
MRSRARIGILFCVLLAAALSPAVAGAQVKRTVLQRVDVGGGEPKECVFATAEIQPGATVGKHFHHGFEVAYVAQGELDLMVEGEEKKHFKAGDTYRVDAGKPHDAKNTGSTPAVVVVSYVVEKGKPLAEPVK